jgi:hypothetical protein
MAKGFDREDLAMFYVLPDNSVHDRSGRMLYFSADRFISDICQGDRCFICGSRRDQLPFNDEHILPDWILRRYNLHDKYLALPNGASIRYGGYAIPCCHRCNSEMGDLFESPIREIVAQGHEAIIRYVHEEGSWLFFTWMTLIFLKTHLKDAELRLNLDQRRGTEKIGDSYAWEELHHLHCIARSFYTQCELDPCVHGSVFILPAEMKSGADNFDFCDLYASQTMLLRLGDTAFISVLNDSCAAVNVLSEKLNNRPAPFSPMQLREIMAHCAFVNLNLKERPVFVSEFKPKEKRYVITAREPEQLSLGECMRSQFGEILYPLLEDYLSSIASSERQDIAEAVKQGRFSFFSTPLDQ